MIIDQKLLDDLSAQAKANPRLRQSYDLRTTPDDNSQRMLNALEPSHASPEYHTPSFNEPLQKPMSNVIKAEWYVKT